jgi:hypothetical protein
MGNYNGLAARNGQRHITGVMFSAVVHQSMTATSQCVVNKERDLRMTTRASKRREGQARVLPGVGGGGAEGGRHHTTIRTKTRLENR